jgi:DNA repair exonuclease SbcCD nuclease subunit
MPKKYNLRFMHIADVHLGKRQYGLDQRAEDFAISFDWVCGQAIINKVDFVIIAGDLFDKRNVNAKTLEQATKPLRMLSDKKIPVFIIEGNHDRPYYRDKMGWIEYLSERKLVRYMALGRFIKFKDVEISFPSVLIENDIVDDLFHIGVLHAGVEGIIPNMGGCISREDINKIKNNFHYLALGHIHKPYEIDGWIFNPGSTEHWSISESGWNGGYYLVDVNTKTKSFKTKHVITPKRTMVRFEFDDNGVWGLTQCAHNGAIVEITLIGETKDKPDMDKLKEYVYSTSPGVLYLKIVDKTTRPDSVDTDILYQDREDIEKEVIDELTGDKKLTALILELKEHIDDDAEDLLGVIKDENI